jgi:hypothetical protein
MPAAYMSKYVALGFTSVSFMPLSQLRKKLVMKRTRESDNDATLHAKEFAVESGFFKMPARRKYNNHNAISIDML